MRIEIIGNSHAAALRRALNDDASRYPCSFDFLVRYGGSGPHLEVRDGWLHAVGGANPAAAEVNATPEEPLDPASCDAILFAATGIQANRQKFRRHLLNDLLHAGFAPRPYAGRQSVSGQVLALAIERALHATGSMKSLKVIRSAFAGPMVIMTSPIPGPRLDEISVPSELPAQYEDNLMPFMSWYYGEQIRVISSEAQRIGASILTPPAEFLEAGFTPVELCSRDRWHANHVYGHLMLQRALQLIGAPAA